MSAPSAPNLSRYAALESFLSEHYVDLDTVKKALLEVKRAHEAGDDVGFAVQTARDELARLLLHTADQPSDTARQLPESDVAHAGPSGQA